MIACLGWLRRLRRARVLSRRFIRSPRNRLVPGGPGCGSCLWLSHSNRADPTSPGLDHNTARRMVKKPGKAMRPTSTQSSGSLQRHQIRQQGRPHLPAHRVGVVPQKIGQLQGLPGLQLEERLDLPPAAGKGQPRCVGSTSGCWSGTPVRVPAHPPPPAPQCAASAPAPVGWGCSTG